MPPPTPCGRRAPPCWRPASTGPAPSPSRPSSAPRTPPGSGSCRVPRVPRCPSSRCCARPAPGNRPTGPPTWSRPWPNSWAPRTEWGRRPVRSWPPSEAARAARTARTARCACTACSPNPWSPTRGTAASAPGSPDPTAASSRSATWRPAVSGAPWAWPTGPCAWGTARSPTASWAGPVWRSRGRRCRRTADWARGRASRPSPPGARRGRSRRSPLCGRRRRPNRPLAPCGPPPATRTRTAAAATCSSWTSNSSARYGNRADPACSPGAREAFPSGSPSPTTTPRWPTATT